MAEKAPEVEARPLDASRADEAFKYLETHSDQDVDGVNLTALRRKIDKRIIPFMFCCYTLQFLDKVMLNVCAPVQSLLGGQKRAMKLTNSS